MQNGLISAIERIKKINLREQKKHENSFVVFLHRGIYAVFSRHALMPKTFLDFINFLYFIKCKF